MGTSTKKTKIGLFLIKIFGEQLYEQIIDKFIKCLIKVCTETAEDRDKDQTEGI